MVLIRTVSCVVGSTFLVPSSFLVCVTGGCQEGGDTHSHLSWCFPIGYSHSAFQLKVRRAQRRFGSGEYWSTTISCKRRTEDAQMACEMSSKTLLEDAALHSISPYLSVKSARTYEHRSMARSRSRPQTHRWISGSSAEQEESWPGIKRQLQVASRLGLRPARRPAAPLF